MGGPDCSLPGIVGLAPIKITAWNWGQGVVAYRTDMPYGTVSVLVALGLEVKSAIAAKQADRARVQLGWSTSFLTASVGGFAL